MLFDEFYWVEPTDYPGALNEAKGIRMDCPEGICLPLGREGFGMPPVEVNIEDLVGGGGMVTHARWGIREFKLPVTFVGSDQQQLIEHVDRWTRRFRPVNTDGSPRICRMRRYRADGSVREISCIYVDGMQRLEQEELRAEALNTTLTFRTEDPFWSDLTVVRYNVFDNAIMGKRIRINLLMNPDFDKAGPQWAEVLEGGRMPTGGSMASNIVTDFDVDIKDIPRSTVPWTTDDNSVWPGPSKYKIIPVPEVVSKGRTTANSWTVEGDNFEWDTILTEKADTENEYITSITAKGRDGVAVLYQTVSGLDQGVQYTAGANVIPVVGRVRMGMDFYNSDYAKIGSVSTPWYDAGDAGVIEALNKGFPLNLQHTFVVPEDNALAIFKITCAPSEGNSVPYSFLLVDKVILEKGTELGYWFDGNSKNLPSGMVAGWIDPQGAPNSRSYAEPLKKESYTILEKVDRDWFPIPPIQFSTASRSQEMTLYNNGHGDAWPTWVIGGPIEEIRLVNLELNQFMHVNFNREGLPENMRLPDGIPAGSTLIIDTWKKDIVITYNNGTSSMKAFYYRTPDSRFWPFVPGENRFTIEIAGATKDTVCMFYYKRRWLSA